MYSNRRKLKRPRGSRRMVADVLDKDALRGTQARLAELRAQLADLITAHTREL